MELFTLGIGPYTETDVKEAARALTGWKIAQGAFRDWQPDHDDGEKTILGRKGRWKGGDLLRIVLEHPATSRRLAWRLCEWLMGEKVIDAAALDALAVGLRGHNLSWTSDQASAWQLPLMNEYVEGGRFHGQPYCTYFLLVKRQDFGGYDNGDFPLPPAYDGVIKLVKFTKPWRGAGR